MTYTEAKKLGLQQHQQAQERGLGPAEYCLGGIDLTNLGNKNVATVDAIPAHLGGEYGDYAIEVITPDDKVGVYIIRQHAHLGEQVRCGHHGDVGIVIATKLLYTGDVSRL